ncbi:U-box domain-containing protein 15 isoform X1 [Ziziphus jujuba]|uniref:RING-type E3 ubiquitin transferase n=1 Tax=Ziziphus jujuba TaxID=326968 RepID=A0A6P6GFT7_ZIZJJ|nr:U-box domain-containing protein 15 isoform X1 [Ziziphus jujuba]XP_015893054.3 U-box domain-containing protein 15 isoform X1 [Ziziphus jujuba]XP_024932983.3 U-box domain-containing protein 15 isoform X1 [Ziziphus jujuba]
MERQIAMEGEETGNMVSSKKGGDGDEKDLVGELMGLIESLGSYSGFRKTQRKECFNLVRRLKLLIPLLEEIKEIDSLVSSKALSGLGSLKKALQFAKKLLKDCNYGSKIYLALESEAVMGRFQAVYDKLNQVLDEMPYNELGISVEVKEQVELMHKQLKRAKRRTDTQDIELAMDLMVVFSKKNDDRNADHAILQRLASKLELHTIADLKEETVAVQKLVKRRGQNAENLQQTKDLLDKFKEIAGFDEDSILDGPVLSHKTLQRCQSSLIPHEFLCPITLEIMTDPVIVASGQTYERASIQKWLFSNHRTCPKTGKPLEHLSLAPNFALKNLIRQWCENNHFELPMKDPFLGSSDGCYAEIIEEISCLVENISSHQLDVQMEAVMQIRMLSKENPENRILIAKSGGIPPLIKLLSYPDSKIQEHTVTALLNLSIDETNKRIIAREGAIPAIIDILKNGTDEGRENSAATLFSLSMLDENKELVGTLNGIPSLVELLWNGTIRGRKDAATALFNLSLNQANKSRAIKAGIIPPLLYLLQDKNLGMVDEALSILLLIASHPEGRNEIGRLSFIETLVEILRCGTPKNKECAASVLLELGLNNSSFILAALQFGVYEHLVELARCGTNRAQRKANSLLQHMSKCEHIP